MKYKYQLDSFKMSCNEELVNVQTEMYKVEQSLKRIKDEIKSKIAEIIKKWQAGSR